MSLFGRAGRLNQMKERSARGAALPIPPQETTLVLDGKRLLQECFTAGIAQTEQTAAEQHNIDCVQERRKVRCR